MLEFVVESVKQASEYLRKEVERPGGPRGARYTAPVDAEIGAFLTERLGNQYPDAAIICEEGGSRPGQGHRAFLVDPNDGTRDFLLGHRENSIAVGLVADGKLQLGVVYAPFATPLTGPDGLLVTWAEGQPLCCNEQPVQSAAAETSLSEQSLVLISTQVTGKILEQNRALLAPAQIQYCPSIATRLALVAVGRATAAGTAQNPLQSWDFAAAQALLQAAGGDLVGEGGTPIRWQGIQPASPGQRIYFGARHTPLAQDVVHRLSTLGS